MLVSGFTKASKIYMATYAPFLIELKTQRGRQTISQLQQCLALGIQGAVSIHCRAKRNGQGCSKERNFICKLWRCENMRLGGEDGG